MALLFSYLKVIENGCNEKGKDLLHISAKPDKIYILLIKEVSKYSRIKSSLRDRRLQKDGTNVFGYVRPCKPEMLVKEYELYKSAYCSLCKHLGKFFGRLSRLALSYDATFLAMLHMSLKQECPGFSRGRCVVNPIKKCTYCNGGEESFLFAGAVSVLMTYYKIRDDIQDCSIAGKFRAYLLIPFVKRSYQKAKRKFPEVDQIVSHCMEQQAQVEQNPSAGIDSSAESTAQMLSQVLLLLSNGTKSQELVLGQLGYFLGRWIYLMDAADDIEKDQKHHQFNPFLKKFATSESEPKISKSQEAFRDYCNEVLNQTLSQALAAFNLLELHHFGTILDNTIRLGLPAMQKQILYDDKEIEHV